MSRYRSFLHEVSAMPQVRNQLTMNYQLFCFSQVYFLCKINLERLLLICMPVIVRKDNIFYQTLLKITHIVIV